MLNRIAKKGNDQLSKIDKKPKWLRIILIAFLTLILLIVAFFGIMSWYINANKHKIIQQVEAAAFENLNGGNLNIEDIDVVFWKTFPNLSIELRNVTLSDSLYSIHQKNLFDIKYVFVHINPFSILTGKPQVGRIILENGAIYMFKDSSAYSNLQIFQVKQQPDADVGTQEMNITKFGIRNVQFVFDNFHRNKKFDITINHINGHLNINKSIIEISSQINVQVGQLGFHLQKGGFLTQTPVEGPLDLTFHKIDKQLNVTNQRLQLNGVPVQFSAQFHFQPDNKHYEIELQTDQLDFVKGKAMVSTYIAQKLNFLQIKKPFKLDTKISGFLQYPDTPQIVVNYILENNILKLNDYDVTNANVVGSFTNSFIPNHGFGNENSGFFIHKMQAHFEGIPLVLDSSYVLNFSQPKLYCNIRSSFPVEKLDELAGASFNLKKGQADLNIFYSGPLSPNDTMAKSLIGYINIKNTALTYLPRNLKFDNCNARIEFKDQNVYLKRVQLNSQKSQLQIDGVGHNFLSAYFNDQFKTSFDLSIHSPQIDLNEFQSFLATRKKATSSTKNTPTQLHQLSDQLDKALDLSDMRMSFDVGKLTFNHFEATKIHADVLLQTSGLSLNNAVIHHAGGSIKLDASLNHSLHTSPFNANINIDKVNISDLFGAFDNFGLSSVKKDNIRGLFSGGINITGGFNHSGLLLSKSLSGSIKFQLNNGALINFAPLLQVQKFAFKNRNLDHITFENLHNTFDIHNGLITIHPMEIISSAIYLKVHGIYGIDKGTDLYIAAPLRNPKKDAALIAKGKKAQRNKGIILHLRAKDDGTGKVKINWDPLKKGWNDNDLQEADKEDKEE